MAMLENERRNVVRHSRPSLELLEGRQLLSGVSAAQLAQSPILRPKQIEYLTPSGGVATVTLKGVGNLSLSSIDPTTGALNLVIGGTGPNTFVTSKVKGGNGYAPLQSVSSQGANPASGAGGTMINTVRLDRFDLVAGGNINLLSGVGKLFLHTVSAGAQIQLRDIPNATPVSTSIQLNSLTSPTSGTGGGPAYQGTPIIGTNNDNTPFSVPSTYSSQGRTQSYVTTGTGAVYLKSVSFTAGQTQMTPGINQIGQLSNGQPPPPPGIPGVLLNVGQIQGTPTAPVTIDVKGNLQAIKAGGATNMNLTDEGDLGMTQINTASDSVIKGFPIGHISIPHRSNVSITSTARVVGTRAGVVVDPTMTSSSQA